MESGNSPAVDSVGGPDLSVNLPASIERHGLYVVFVVMSILVLIGVIIAVCLVILICIQVGPCCVTIFRGEFLYNISIFLFLVIFALIFLG